MPRLFRQSLLMIATLSLLISGSCADDLRHRIFFEDGVDDVMLSFSVEDISLSRAGEGRDIETLIDHAYLLFYSSDAVLDADLPLAAARAVVSETDPSVLKFKLPLQLEPDTDYTLLAIANPDSYTPEGFSTFRNYLEAWISSPAQGRQPLQLFRAEPMAAENLDCVPMRGKIADGDSFRFSNQGGVYKVAASLSFRRKVARIDVANMVKEEFLIEGIALCNWRDAVSVASNVSQLGNRSGGIHGVLSEVGEDSEEATFVAMPEADESGIQQLKKSIYCFPSVSYEARLSDHESTALIIKARYGEDEESSYYRVNVGQKGNRSEVKENTKYLVTIQSVKGRGAATPEEAYASEESLIILSIVEDWDLDGCFAMDEDGNFLLLSTGRLEFDGGNVAKREIRVLTSKGLTWNVEYIADNDESASAFSATRLSDISLAIGPTGENNNEKDILTGKFVVTAHTPEGGTLSVDILVVQNPATGSEVPDIPDDIPFTLVPMSDDRVKVDHQARTIEIDGFDPDCFNSFIDIPFTVNFKNPGDGASAIDLTTDLQWPLEGRVAIEMSSQYLYCKESFALTGTPKVTNKDGIIPTDNDNLSISSIYVHDREPFYISVGAMGPDDPPIIRNLNLSDKVTYKLIIKPCDCIIDDVVMLDGKGGILLVQDRNVQDFLTYGDYVGLDENGRKRQAYNYNYIPNNSLSGENVGLMIPFKFKTNEIQFGEMEHYLYRGKTYTYADFSDINDLSNDGVVSRLSWLKRYCSSGDMSVISPFYQSPEETLNSKKWNFPSESDFGLWAKKLRVSKMRMFFVSDVSVRDGDKDIPVCCYLPYHSLDMNGMAATTAGYFMTNDGLDASNIVVVYFEKSEGKYYKTSKYASRNGQLGFTRLVRTLTQEELDDYKTNYLGYGSQPHRLQLCHPDTYTSEPLGWLPY